MSLRLPLDGGHISQRFGPSQMAVQPTMWYLGTIKAYWVWFQGAVLHDNVHAGTDFAGMPAGSPLRAAEAGTVTRAAYDKYNGGGWVVEVEIRAGTRYSYNHCNSLSVKVGQKVSRGQVIATVGATGTIWNGSYYVRSTYGVHCHTNLLILESGRWMLYDFADFMLGGAQQNDARIRPGGATSYPLITLVPGFNVRSTPDLDVGDANIAYLTRADGVYDRTGKKVANLSGWQLRGTTTNDDGSWGHLYGLGRHVYVINGGYRR